MAGIIDSAMAGLHAAIAGGDTDDSEEQVAKKIRPFPVASPATVLRAAGAPSNSSDKLYAPGTAPAAPVSPASPAPPAAAPSLGNMLNPPTYNAPDPAVRTGLVAKENQLRRPLDPNAPEYKPSLGRKLLGIAAAAGLGFAKQPGLGMEVGGDIIHSKYNQAEKQRTADLASAEKNIQDYDKTRSDTLSDFKAKSEAYRDMLEADKPYSQELQDDQGNGYYATPSGRKLPAFDKKANEPDQTPKTIEAGAAAEISKGVKGGPFQTELEKERKFQQSANDPLKQIQVQLAQQRLDDAQQGRVDKVQKEAEDQTTKHKAGIQKRIDELQKKVDEGSLDETSPQYKKQMAQIERDDYAGMNAIGNSLSSRLKGFGINVDAPKPEPWQESNLDEGERARLLGGPSQSAAPVSGKGPQKAPTNAQPAQSAKKAKPVNELKGHKNGDVVTLKGGQKVKITQLYADGSFDHQPVK